MRVPDVLVPGEEVGEGHVADGADCSELLLLLLLLPLGPRLALLVMVLLSLILILLWLQ